MMNVIIEGSEMTTMDTRTCRPVLRQPVSGEIPAWLGVLDSPGHFANKALDATGVHQAAAVLEVGSAVYEALWGCG